MALNPFQGLQCRQGLALFDQIINGGERSRFGVARHGHDEDAVIWQVDCPGSFESGVEEGKAGEKGFGAGSPELMLDLGGRVGGTGRGNYAGKAVDSVSEREVVDLP